MPLDCAGDMACAKCGQTVYFAAQEETLTCPYCGTAISRFDCSRASARRNDCGTHDSDWRDRANRREYWIKSLIVIGIIYGSIAIAKSLEGVVSNGILVSLLLIIWIVTLVWSLGVLRRRLHDFGLSGWWILLWFVVSFFIQNFFRATLLNDLRGLVELALFVWVGVHPGVPSSNEYGAVPPRKAFRWWL